MKAAKLMYVCLLLFSLVVVCDYAEAAQLKIAIMQDVSGAAQNYRPLADYLNKKGIEVEFIGVPSYPSAAKMFAAGEVDAMFSGSGVAGTMIIKDLTDPLVRPLGKDGFSTYWAVVLASKGSPKFTGSADYFKGKKVIFTSLASSGEFYFRSIPNIASAKATTLYAASHGAAIDALSRGTADIAIVKNRVWDKMKDKYPNLIKVGEDKEENPDNTLIVSKKTSKDTISKLSSALLLLKDDSSQEAQAARNTLNIQGYIKTTRADFKHTLEILKKAGVDKSFNFTFK